MTTVVLNTTTRKVEVYSSARDVQARAEIAAHAAAADPHPQYLADVEAADIATSGNAADLIAGTLPDGRMPGWTGYTAASKAALEAAIVPPVVAALNLLGHAAAGDGGGARYRRVASEPSHPGKIQSADGAWWEIAENVLNVRQFGAVGDCTAVDTGTDDSAAFQAAVDTWITHGPGRVLTVPHGRYRIASTVTADFAGGHGFSFLADGWITPDATLERGFLFHNATEGSLRFQVWEGGQDANYSEADPTGKTEAVVLRGWRGVRADVRGWGYHGRVLRTERQLEGEFKTAFMDIHMLTGHVSAPYSRCGQALFADDGGVGDGQGAWGAFHGGCHWDTYGPVWEDLNDVRLIRLEGSAQKKGVQFRGTRVVNINQMYYGDTPDAAFRSGEFALIFKLSESGTGRACARITGDQLRFLQGGGGLRAQDLDTAAPGLVITAVHGNLVNGPLVSLDNVRQSCLGIYPTSCNKALDITGSSTRALDLHIMGSGFSEDAITIGLNVATDTPITLSGELLAGAAGTVMLKVTSPASRIMCRDLTLLSGNVDAVFDLPAGNSVKWLGGRYNGVGTTTFKDGIRPSKVADTFFPDAEELTRTFAYPAGRYFWDMTIATGTFTVVANTLYAVPFVVAYPMELSAVVLRVTTAAAGNMRLSIYRDDGGYPGDLVEDAGTSDTGTTGTKEHATTRRLEVGKYWLAAVFDATPNVRSPGQVSTTHVFAPVGYSTDNPINNSTHIELGVKVAHTYSDALDATFPGGGSRIDVTECPAIGLKT